MSLLLSKQQAKAVMAVMAVSHTNNLAGSVKLYDRTTRERWLVEWTDSPAGVIVVTLWSTHMEAAPLERIYHGTSSFFMAHFD